MRKKCDCVFASDSWFMCGTFHCTNTYKCLGISLPSPWYRRCDCRHHRARTSYHQWLCIFNSFVQFFGFFCVFRHTHFAEPPFAGLPSSSAMCVCVHLTHVARCNLLAAARSFSHWTAINRIVSESWTTNRKHLCVRCQRHRFVAFHLFQFRPSHSKWNYNGQGGVSVRAQRSFRNSLMCSPPPPLRPDASAFSTSSMHSENPQNTQPFFVLSLVLLSSSTWLSLARFESSIGSVFMLWLRSCVRLAGAKRRITLSSEHWCEVNREKRIRRNQKKKKLFNFRRNVVSTK